MHRRLSGFALVDAALRSDPKFRELHGLVGSEDEFATCVGYWTLSLVASRLRGSPVIPDQADLPPAKVHGLLIQAGLMTPAGFPPEAWAKWAPKSQQALAGEARAAQASRQADGTFAPSSRNQRDQPAGPAGQAGRQLDDPPSGTQPAGHISSSALDQLDKLVQPVLLSSPKTDSGEVPGGGVGEPDDTDLLELLAAATGRLYPSPKTISWADELISKHGKARVLEAIRLNLDKAPRAMGPAAQWLEMQEGVEARHQAEEQARRAEAARDRRISEQRRRAQELQGIPQPARSFGEIMGDLGLKIRKAES